MKKEKEWKENNTHAIYKTLEGTYAEEEQQVDHLFESFSLLSEVQVFRLFLWYLDTHRHIHVELYTCAVVAAGLYTYLFASSYTYTCTTASSQAPARKTATTPRILVFLFPILPLFKLFGFLFLSCAHRYSLFYPDPSSFQLSETCVRFSVVSLTTHFFGILLPAFCPLPKS